MDRVCVSKKIELIKKLKDGTITEEDLKNYGYTMQQLRKEAFYYDKLGKRGLNVTQTQWAERAIDDFIERATRPIDLEAAWRKQNGYA